MKRNRSGKASRIGIEIFEAVHDKAAGHAAEHLLGDNAMRVRVIPEETGSLATGGRNAHLVLELLTGVDVDEHVVAVALRRHAHAVIVQVRRIVGEVVPEGDPHGVAKPWPEQRRQIRSVVKQPRKCKVAELNPTRRRRDRRSKDAVLAANFRRLNQRLLGLRDRAIHAKQCAARRRYHARPQDISC